MAGRDIESAHTGTVGPWWSRLSRITRVLSSWERLVGLARRGLCVHEQLNRR